MKTNKTQLTGAIDRLSRSLSAFHDCVEIDPEGSAARLTDSAREMSILLAQPMRVTVPDYAPRMGAMLAARAGRLLVDVDGCQQRAAASRLRAVARIAGEGFDDLAAAMQEAADAAMEVN